MNAQAKYSTQFVHLGLLALAACAVAGCWKEIEYTPPTTADARREEPQNPAVEGEESPDVEDQADSSATNFADDLATSLDPTPSGSSSGGPASGSGEQSRATGGEELSRYAETPPVTPAEPPRYSEPNVVKQDGPVRFTPIAPPVDDEPRYPETQPPPQDLRPTPPPVTSPPIATAPVTTTPVAPRPAAKPPQTTRTPASSAAANTRRVAWLLGAKLSLAALAHDRNIDPAEVAKWFSQSQTLAKLLGTSVDPLPPATSAASSPNSSYMITQGQRVGRDLATRYGEDHAALFELAAKSNILISLYEPRSPDSNALAEAIARAGQRAGLPESLFEPLVKSVRLGDPAPAVRQAVQQLNRALDQQLNAPTTAAAEHQQ